ncbi:MAG TPA: hypothetical protein VGS10_19655 [Terracidiphilus sp.]|nr:hypothetical protein [Terracidiphilus sp.]
MTELLSVLNNIDFNGAFGLWMFLSIGAVALFAVFIPLVVFFESRRKEREAFYRAEMLRRVSEAPGEAAKAAIELLHEEERLTTAKKIEGMKVGGLVNIGLGVALLIFLRFMIGSGPGSPYLCGLIPAFIGVALLAYALFLAPHPERRN